MPFYRFSSTDKFVNTIVTYPSIEFVLYNGNAYYNQDVVQSGAYAPVVKYVPTGHKSLYEYNIDRPTGSFGKMWISPGGAGVENTGLIYPYTVKDGTRISFKTVTTVTFDDTYNVGDVIPGAYLMSASVSKYFYPSGTLRHVPPVIDTTTTDYLNHGFPHSITNSGSITYLHAIKNIMKNYQYSSPHYAVSSSTAGGGRDLTASLADITLPPVSVGNGAGAIDVGLISIPSIFTGAQIKRGTVKLKFYVTGALQGELSDRYQTGELVQTSPAGSVGSGSVAGVVLYNEGIIVLTGSWDLSNGQHKENYTSSSVAPAWVYFGQAISGSITAPSSSWSLEASGTTKTQVLTLFADAKKGELNHSNNPSFLTFAGTNVTSSARTRNQSYTEVNTRTIKNVVSSSYNDPTGSFEKTTYISKIGIYDENKNLIAIAKSATPIRKTENRDFTFKLKLDI